MYEIKVACSTSFMDGTETARPGPAEVTVGDRYVNDLIDETLSSQEHLKFLTLMFWSR